LSDEIRSFIFSYYIASVDILTYNMYAENKSSYLRLGLLMWFTGVGLWLEDVDPFEKIDELLGPCP